MPVTAEILSTDYYKMAVPDADAIYNGKWISVTGVVKSKSLNANPGVITVCLKCIHDFALIDCRFDPRWKLDLEKIKGVDQVVTIKGKCTTRKLNNIIILDCVLVKA